jgi:hypothetical protein
MLVAHLLVGVLAGVFALLASLLLGFSGWAAIGCFVLGSNIGLVTSAIVAIAANSIRDRLARHRAERRVRLTLGSLLMVLLGVLALGWSHAR